MLRFIALYLLSFITAIMCQCDIADLNFVATEESGDIIYSMSCQGVYGNSSIFTNAAGQPQTPDADPYGCSNDSYGRHSSSTAQWIAIIKRGNCRISQKIDNSIYLRNASAVIIYNNVAERQLPSFTHRGYPAVSVLVSMEDGWRILEFLNQSNQANVSVSIARAAPQRSQYDPITAIITALATGAAVTSNAGVIFAICKKKTKCKPYVLFVINILATDVVIGIFSAVQVALLYEAHHECRQHERVQETRQCVAAFFSRLWDVLLYSNLLSILLLTGEQFLAFRWPLSHRRFITKGRVKLTVVLSWIIAIQPDGITAAHALLSFKEPMSKLCHYLVHDELQGQYWGLAACVVVTTTVALAALISVHGYILYYINKLSIGKLEGSQKRKAFVTSTLLVGSFVASYALLYAVNFNIALERTATTQLLVKLRQSLIEVLPTSPLIFDFLINGMLGAILNPIIYLVRDNDAQTLIFGGFQKVIQKQLSWLPKDKHETRPCNGKMAA